MTGPARLRLAVLASGRGSNLQAILDAIARGELPADVAAVFSDRPQSLALQRARDAGIEALAVVPSGFDNRSQFDEHLFSRIDAVHPDVIVCAGYMRLISADAVEARSGRMINIHPSLLPAFKGLHTHRQALAEGATRHGASVHFVTADLDGGPVIAQAAVDVRPGDSEASLAARVLDVEHPLLVATLKLFAARRVGLVAGAVTLDGEALRAPLQLDAAGALC